MATQAEAISFIKSTYVIANEDDGMMFLMFDQGDGRSQGVFVFVDEMKMGISSAFATTKSISADQALNAASDKAFGIGREGDYYVVKHVVPIADLDPSVVIVGIEITANMADELESALGLGDVF